MKRWSQRIRSRHLIAVDVIGLTLALLVALGAWQDRLPGATVVGTYLWIGGIAVCAHVAVNILLGLYTNSWRYASVGDMGRILACTFGGTASAALIVLLISAIAPSGTPTPPSASFWLVEATLALGALATPRFLIRAASDLSDRIENRPEQERTLLYGAGWAGVMVARSAERDGESGVTPVGFLDDNVDLKGRRVSGLLVYGDTRDLGRAKQQTGATALLITMTRASGDNVRRVVEAAMALGLDVRTVPAMTDLIDGTIDASRARGVQVEDLLRRPLATEHSPALQRLLAGRTVMVTGAAGSIGSELVRQLLALEPARIVMVDQAESAMYMIARDLETRAQVQEGKTAISTHLVDITDRESVFRLMCETEPIVVFHAAAYKHVPMLERHASQAARVNLGGTASVVDAAVACGVERFVLVSTDKAVRPSSVMGASKRMAEMIVAEAAQRTGRFYVSVRFGNVLGSNGSVIPVFQAQLENGQPLTLTDPEMTRYFMTIPEASWLILDAAALSHRGGLYVLDMGEPVRVLDVAHDLIRLSGRDPDSVPIKTIGLRPGEKLHEELFYEDEEVAPTEVAKVLRSTTHQQAPPTIRQDVERYLALAGDGQDGALRTALLQYVRTSGDGLRPAIAVPVETAGTAEATRFASAHGGNGRGGNGRGGNGRGGNGRDDNGRGADGSAPTSIRVWGNGSAPQAPATVLDGQRIVIKPSGSQPSEPSTSAPDVEARHESRPARTD